MHAPWYRGQIVHVATRPGSVGEYAEIDLPAWLADYLEAHGIRLYRHQADVIEAFRCGRDVIVTTPTASGKTLAFTFPILEALEKDRRGCALFLYPLKALANDQLGKLAAIDAACDLELRPATYDGDTPPSQRPHIKRTSRVVLTNPHALHQYLPWHHQWARLFANLRAVVLDEAHQYRGVYGGSVAYLLRRLLRIAHHYGGSPRIVLSSASVDNPAEFARSLTGRDAVPITSDGSVRGEKKVVFWDSQLDPTRSMMEQAARLLASLTGRGTQAICFTRTRGSAERIAQRASELGATGIVSYRAGYLPQQRRDVEAGLRSGTVRGVVSTTALEAGIDIGGLDAAILVGFPGSLLSAWQQAGRAGRGVEPSLLIYLPGQNPLDRYFCTHPEVFLGSERERLVVPVDHPAPQAGHLLCAAAELPLRESELTAGEVAVVDALRERGLLSATARGSIYRGLRRAHEMVGLDDVEGDSIRMICEGRLLETMDPVRARREAFPGAVYLHRGEAYVVERLDLEEGRVEVRREDIDAVTHSLRGSQVDILSCDRTHPLQRAGLSCGRVRVTESYLGYRTFHADRTISIHPLDLPAHIYETDAVWTTFREPPVASVPPERLAGALHGAEHALIAMTPLLVLCDASDLGGMSTPLHPQTGGPSIILFDDISEGAGLAQAVFDGFGRLARRAHTLVRDCRCEAGCPACLLSPRCGSGNEPLWKPGAAELLRILGEEHRSSAVAA